MRVLFLSWAFPPYHQSGSFRAEAFATYLPSYGIEPIVVCGGKPDRSHHYSDESVPERNPKKQERPIVERVDEWKYDYTPDHQIGSNGKRSLRLPLIGEIAAHRFRNASVEAVVQRAAQVAPVYQPKVIYATSPPESANLAAHRLAGVLHLPVVYDLRDPWSYRAIRPYYHRASFWLEKRLESSVLAKAARVIANTETARRLLISKLHLRPDNVEVIPNGFDDAHFNSADGLGDYLPGKFVAAYTGAFSPFRSPKGRSFKAFVKRRLGFDYSPVASDGNTRSAHFFLKAAECLLDKHPQIRGRFRIAIVGSQSERDLALFRQFRYPDVLMLIPPMARREAVELCCRVQLLLLLQLEVKIGGQDCCAQVPGKLYDYLRSGTRILAPLQPGETQELIEKHRAGTVVGPRDVDAIERALLEEFQEWECPGSAIPSKMRNGLEHYSRSALAGRLAHVLHEVARGR